MPSGSGAITYPRFCAALKAGDLRFIRQHAKDLPRIRLSDALRICLLIRDGDSENYERAAVRWLGRFALEAPTATLDELQSAVGAFDLLCVAPDEAMVTLSTLCVRHGLGN